MCVFSFVRQKMNDERNVIFDVCCVLLNETNFFLPAERKKTKAKKHTHSSFFPFLFFSHASPFLSFFSQTSNVRPSNAPNFSHEVYIF